VVKELRLDLLKKRTAYRLVLHHFDRVFVWHYVLLHAIKACKGHLGHW